MILKNYARAPIPKKYRIRTHTHLCYYRTVRYRFRRLIDMDACERREYKYIIKLSKCVREINTLLVFIC